MQPPERRLAVPRWPAVGIGHGPPQAACHSAPVPLPEGRVLADCPGQQDRVTGIHGEVADWPERQLPVIAEASRTIGHRYRVGPGVVREGLAGGGDRDYLTSRTPAAHLGAVIGPVR